MAINYGANEVRSSGKIIGGDGQSAGRTLYFYAASGSDWNTVGNWFVDRDHTLASNSLPTDEDTAVILSTITSNGGSFVADTIIFENGNLDFSGYFIGEVRNIILKNSSELKGYGTIGSSTGTRVKIDLYDSSKLYFSSSNTTIYGDVNFHETSYIDTSSQSITIEGNVNVTSSGGNSSYQPIYGSSSYGVTILGDLRVVGNGSNTITIRYVKVFGKTELFQNVKITECPGSSYGFYGPVILTEDCIIDDNVYFYNDVTLNENSIIDGTGIYMYNENSVLTLNSSSYFNSSAYITMYGGTVILNSASASSAGTATIGGDQYTTVEVRYNFGSNGLGLSSTINCGFIKVCSGAQFGDGSSVPTLSTSLLKKMQFFNESELYSSLTVANACLVEFYDDSSLTNSKTLTLGDDNTAIAKFYDRSYIDPGCTIANGSHVEMNDFTSNLGTISSNFAFFKGWSASEGDIDNDAAFSDRAENAGGTIGGNASFNDHSINTGAITGDAVFNGFSKHSTGGSAQNVYYMGPLSADGGTDSASYVPTWM